MKKKNNSCASPDYLMPQLKCALDWKTDTDWWRPYSSSEIPTWNRKHL